MKSFFLRNLLIVTVLSISLGLSSISLSAPLDGGDVGPMMGISFGGAKEDAYMDVCPQGARVILAFLKAWSVKDYETMYSLIDDESKVNYPFEEAKFDFEFMDYKQYKISSARQQGDNFEFILSHGEWKYGDKDIKKVLINGRSFKIMMSSRGVLFKKSADSYFN